MKIIDQSFEILSEFDGKKILKQIEKIARTCYKSEDSITDGSAEKLIKMLVEKGHHAMIEHFAVSVKFITNRGMTHELVRHRMASYAQESTRYCNYQKDKFGNEITVIKPYWYESASIEAKKIWENAIKEAEKSYMLLLQNGLVAQGARGILPNDLKTEIVVTANLREWIHIFDLRCSTAAHPDIRIIMLKLLRFFHDNIPIIFDLVYEKYKNDIM